MKYYNWKHIETKQILELTIGFVYGCGRTRHDGEYQSTSKKSNISQIFLSTTLH